MLLPLDRIATPAYVADRRKIRENLAVAARIKAETGCKILLATKAFSMFSLFGDFAAVLDGTTASGLYEARLGHEHFGGEVHAYSPAYSDAEIDALIPICHHIYFNSVLQLQQFAARFRQHHGDRTRVGLRVNPRLSLVKNNAIYDPSAPNSRFGVPMESLTPEVLAQIDILHVHNLCENMVEDSVALIDHLMQKIPQALDAVQAINLGGGHYIAHPDYDVNALIAAVNRLRKTHDVEVILEPGGALVYDAGYLVARVVDVIQKPEKESALCSVLCAEDKETKHTVQSTQHISSIAILDTSATCHMPDVLEVPYRPRVIGDTENGEYRYLLAGKTCLTGDIIGEYAFETPLRTGDRVIFRDMMQYSMVKNTTFNGMPLPDIGVLEEDGSYRVVRRFGYEDFKGRLS